MHNSLLCIIQSRVIKIIPISRFILFKFWLLFISASGVSFIKKKLSTNKSSKKLSVRVIEKKMIKKLCHFIRMAFVYFKLPGATGFADEVW